MQWVLLKSKQLLQNGGKDGVIEKGPGMEFGHGTVEQEGVQNNFCDGRKGD